MSLILWGRDKNGVARCYALYVPNDEVKEYVARAKKEGWTDLVTSTRLKDANEQGEGKEGREEESPSPSR